MNISNLKVDEKVKNYKELCNILDIPIVSGNSKIYQLKELERYCNFHKEGNGFVFDEIYNIPKEKLDDKRLGNNNIYTKNIQSLILEMLLQSEDKTVCLSCSSLLKSLNMINENYSEGRNNIIKLSELINVPKINCYDFYNYTYSNLKGKLETSLNILRKRALVFWSKVVIVKPNNEEAHRKATNEEIAIILMIEREIMEEMGFDNTQSIFLKGKWSNFKRAAERQLNLKHKIKYYYDAYEIIFNHENIKIEIEKIDIECKKEIENILNEKICDSLNKGAETRYKNSVKKANDFILTSEEEVDDEIKINSIHYKDDYVYNNRILIDITISNKAKPFKLKG